MAEATPQDKALAAQGATTDNLDDGSTGAGAPVAPKEPSNTPPVVDAKEGKDEEHVGKDKTPVVDPAKAAADAAAAATLAAKTAADKVEADGPLKNYITLDNPAGQAAINLLKEAGLGPNAANVFFAKALASGDLKDVDVAGLEAKLGKDKATLVMAGVTSYYQEQSSKTQAIVTQTHEIFGGEANWNTVKTWAQTNEKTDPAFKKQIDDIRGMLNEGGTQSSLAARELLRLYNAAPDNKGLGTSKLAVGTSTGTVIGTVLTRPAYLEELKAAHARNATPAEIKAIDARRKAGMAQRI